jgi:hypothetical protein
MPPTLLAVAFGMLSKGIPAYLLQFEVQLQEIKGRN